LEARVQARLVHRTTRSLTLTPEGIAFLGRCRHILAEIQTAEAELAGAATVPRGRLRISLPLLEAPFFETISAFRWSYPEVEIDVEFTNRKVDLVREGFDAAIRSGDLADSTLMAKDIGAYKMVLVASPDYLARKGTPSCPQDLKDHDRLGLRLPNTGKVLPLALLEGDTMEVEPAHYAVIVSNAAALIHFATSGHGLAYVSDFLIREEIASGALVPVLGEFLDDGGRFHIIWAAGPQVPPKLRAFIDHVSAQLLRR
jgi:DNA-binding transcriptional LysR family regulator